MMAAVYEELKDIKNALTYYRKANKLQPDNYYTLKPLLNLELAGRRPGNQKKMLDD